MIIYGYKVSPSHIKRINPSFGGPLGVKLWRKLFDCLFIPRGVERFQILNCTVDQISPHWHGKTEKLNKLYHMKPRVNYTSGWLLGGIRWRIKKNLSLIKKLIKYNFKTRPLIAQQLGSNKTRLCKKKQ